MRQDRYIARFALVLAIAARAANAGFLTNMDLGDALQNVTSAPVGYKDAKDVTRAVRKGAVVRASVAETIPETVVAEENVVYASRDKVDLHADVFRPRVAASPSPILVFVHGGAWDHGSEDPLRSWGIHYAHHGYACVAITYRLVGVAPYPAALDDVREALRWVHARASEWNANPARIAVIGQSAGAHLALMAAYQTGNAPRVHAVVDFYGPTDLTVKPMRTATVVRKFLGGKRYRTTPELYREASPLTHASAQSPPTLIFHGTIDSRVPVAQSDELARLLRREDVPFLYDRVEGWHHAMDLYAEVNAHCLSVMDVFLNAVLK